MTRLSLALLGPMQIRLGGQPVGGFTYNKARALLVYLAVEADRPHQRDALATLLWPDMPDEAARHNLRQALANLRTAIGDTSATPPFLLITRDTIQFNPGSDDDLDVATFIGLLTACESHAHRHLERCRSCAARMDQAITLYRGDFLAGFGLGDSAPFEEWQLRQREQLHQRALDALARLADYHERRGEDERARHFAQRQIELEPWREEAHRQLMRLLARGHQRSAALAQYEACRRVLERDLGVEPEAETTALYEQIRNGASSELRVLSSELPRQIRETQNSKLKTQNLQNFPAQTTPLIGRETELAELGALLENPAHRLITIVGPGGIGKTRLALAAAAEQAEAFTHGAMFVPLQAISSTAFLAPAILGALDVELQGQRDPRDQLLNYLRGKEQLLVLDNVEQLLVPDKNENEGIADLLSDLLRHAPGVTLLVTSRERLALQGEWLFELSGLSYPLGELTVGFEAYSAVRLFVQRAGQMWRGFALEDGEARAVARICQLVEGMPLAIELAAAALRGRSSIAIAAAIETSFSALATGLRAVPERHRSIRATFEHSWRLLTDEERQVFARLSVFRGGFEEDAAAQVAQASPQLLAALLDKSLLRWDGAARYEMHELVRQYAREKLREAGEEGYVRDHHLDYFRLLAEQAERELIGPRQVAWRTRLDDELDNLRAALEWSADSNILAGLQLASSLLDYWDRYRPVQEGIGWLRHLLGQAEALLHTPARAKALLALSRLSILQNRSAATRSLVEEGLALYHELADERGIASALFMLGLLEEDDPATQRALVFESLALYRSLGDKCRAAEVLLFLGTHGDKQDYTRARAYLEESLTLFRELGHPDGVSAALSNLGHLAIGHGDFAAAHVWLEEALEMLRDLSHMDVAVSFYVAFSIHELGELALRQGDYEQARAYLEESVSLHRERGHILEAQWALALLGFVVLRQGDQAHARTLFIEAQRYFNEAGITIGVVYALEGLASLTVAQGQPERAARMYAWADAAREAVGNKRWGGEQADVDRDLAVIRSQIDEATIAAVQAEGRAMTIEQAIAYALADEDQVATGAQVSVGS